MTDSPSQLITSILQIESWIDAEQKRFDAYLKPHREKIEAFKIQLQEFLLANARQEGGHPKASFSCDAGTAYLSTIVTPSIEGDRTAYLDWILEDWDNRGAMLQIGAPQKAAFQDYLDGHEGQLPPFTKTSSLTRVNVRRG